MWAVATLAGVDKSGGRGGTTEQSHRYQRAVHSLAGCFPSGPSTQCSRENEVTGWPGPQAPNRHKNNI